MNKAPKMDKLEYLARNLSGWSEDTSKWCVVDDNYNYYFSNAEGDDILGYSYKQWEQKRAELQNKPQQWRGPEDGLPPVGTVCEVEFSEAWKKCEVVAHFERKQSTDCVFTFVNDNREKEWGFRTNASFFRPLQPTTSDKLLEIAPELTPVQVDKIVNLFKN